MILQQTDSFQQRVYPAGSPFPADAELYLTQLGVFESQGNFVWEQVSPGFVIHAVTKGKGTIICNEANFDAEKGDLFIFRKGSRYRYYDCPESPWEYTYIGLAGRRAKMLIAELGIDDKTTVLKIPFSNSFWIRLQTITKEFEQTRIAGISSVRAAWELIEPLKKQHDSRQTLKQETLAENARQIIESSPQAITNVNDLAAALHVNRVTLFRCFRQRYNISIKEFMERTRFERIEPLLKNSDLPVQEISRIGGFNDPLYFSRAFRKRYGISPAKWRVE